MLELPSIIAESLYNVDGQIPDAFSGSRVVVIVLLPGLVEVHFPGRDKPPHFIRRDHVGLLNLLICEGFFRLI